MKHPQDRAERLRLKRDIFEKSFKKEVDVNKIRRSILKTQLKEQETEDELRSVWAGANTSDSLP